MGQVNSVAFSPDGSKIVGGGPSSDYKYTHLYSSGTIKVWDAGRPLNGNVTAISSPLTLSPRARQPLSSSRRARRTRTASVSAPSPSRRTGRPSSRPPVTRRSKSGTQVLAFSNRQCCAKAHSRRLPQALSSSRRRRRTHTAPISTARPASFRSAIRQMVPRSYHLASQARSKSGI
jgi:hypothetical protein